MIMQLPFGKILNLYTPNEPLFVVTHNKIEFEDGTKRATEIYITKIPYLALCEDGRIHPIELDGGCYRFCDEFPDSYTGLLNKRQLREMYEAYQEHRSDVAWIVGDEKISRYEW